MSKAKHDNPLAERLNLDFSKGVRGKHYKRMQEGNIKWVPDSDVKNEITKSRTVNFTLDSANPPRWTEEEKASFDAMTDADIDYSDIPDTSDLTGWTRPGLAERKAPASRNGNAAAKKKTSVA